MQSNVMGVDEEEDIDEVVTVARGRAWCTFQKPNRGHLVQVLK
jgi:hypothetical protein